MSYAELVESAVEISRREREERIQRLRNQRIDDRVQYVSQPADHGDMFQSKRQKTCSRLPPGWLECPAFGQEIGCIIPSKRVKPTLLFRVKDTHSDK